MFAASIGGERSERREAPLRTVPIEAREWRRAALVSTIGHDTRRTLRVCAQLRDDREPMVWKALSWALRELAKRDPRAVWAFLGEYELARPVVREVRNKLETGTKAGR